MVDVDVVVVDVFVNLSDDELNKFKRKTDRPKEALVVWCTPTWDKNT